MGHVSRRHILVKRVNILTAQRWLNVQKVHIVMVQARQHLALWGVEALVRVILSIRCRVLTEKDCVIEHQTLDALVCGTWSSVRISMVIQVVFLLTSVFQMTNVLTIWTSPILQ